MNHHLALVVEDDAALRLMYRRILNHGEFKVLEAENGQRALQLLEEYTPDLVLLDMLLPQVNGEAVLNYIHSAPHLQHTHVAMITSSRRYAPLAEGRTNVHFFLKPVNPSEIREMMAQVVSTRV